MRFGICDIRSGILCVAYLEVLNHDLFVVEILLNNNPFDVWIRRSSYNILFGFLGGYGKKFGLKSEKYR